MIKIPICEFGKKLGITDTIEEIYYTKGDKNDIGDSPDDYVVIRCANEYDVMIVEHDGVKEIMSRTKLDDMRREKKDICPKCSYFTCLCKYKSEKL